MPTARLFPRTLLTEAILWVSSGGLSRVSFLLCSSGCCWVTSHHLHVLFCLMGGISCPNFPYSAKYDHISHLQVLCPPLLLLLSLLLPPAPPPPSHISTSEIKQEQQLKSGCVRLQSSSLGAMTSCKQGSKVDQPVFYSADGCKWLFQDKCSTRGW